METSSVIDVKILETDRTPSTSAGEPSSIPRTSTTEPSPCAATNTTKTSVDVA